jgi:hypothetical protein
MRMGCGGGTPTGKQFVGRERQDGASHQALPGKRGNGNRLPSLRPDPVAAARQSAWRKLLAESPGEVKHPALLYEKFKSRAAKTVALLQQPAR